jgi:hypothetical protein
VDADGDHDDLVAGQPNDDLRRDARRGFDHDEGTDDRVVGVVEAALVHTA